ncbi:hypothetical protein NQ318_001031 [Aromia moschata]|uniref:Uncharacterized protein n=1 Tax=Aromia moschata TaxID=1265417 RepID=A0AAV8ZFZ2_9CUCU|nr:hypothetical protein NQ318_001031 [Aromia moschata]
MTVKALTPPSSSSKESESESEEVEKPKAVETQNGQEASQLKSSDIIKTQTKSGSNTETSSNLSVATTTSNNSAANNSSSEHSSSKSATRNVKECHSRKINAAKS